MKKYLVCWLTYGVVWLLQRSWRFVYINPQVRDDAIKRGPKGSICYACWHHSTLTGMLSVAFRRFAVLVSKSSDGDVIAYINAKFGVGSARGSSSRSGKDGMRELLEFVDRGYEVGFTVDGPRGPRHKVKPGVIALAAKTGVPIVPTASCGEKFWYFPRSWDRFRLPKLFSKVYVVYGKPIFVKLSPSESEFQSYQLELEQALLGLEAQLASLVEPQYNHYFVCERSG